MSDFLKYRILVTDTTQSEKPLLLQGSNTILSRGNIACITGKAKSRKTFLVSAITSAFLEKEQLTMKKGIDNGKILFVDTEQARSHVQKFQKRIYKMNGWKDSAPNERLTMLALRPMSSEERMEIIEEAIESINPDIVIIDGVRDLVEDFNDIKSSSVLVRKLMELSDRYECGIITVLHQNKSDNNARGHLGTELTNKVETLLQITSIEDKSIVSPDFSRNTSIEQFAFFVNTEEIPELCEIPKTNIEAVRKEIKKILGQCKSISKQGFVSLYMSKTNKKQSTAYFKIKQAIDAKVLSEANGILVVNDEE